MDKLDYKKEYKDLYLPKGKPMLIEVPPMTFIMVDGEGDPNQEGGAYQQVIELLYALSFTIKMSKMGGNAPPGYFEYVVPPLEGLWWPADGAAFDPQQKDLLHWTSMIRQPEFVDQQVFAWACEAAQQKKPQLDTAKARLISFAEGLCVQCMHHGPYDDEPATLAKMAAYMREQGLSDDSGALLPDGQARRHHEIYLGDPRKTAPDKRKTVLRLPVKPVGAAALGGPL